MGSAVHCSVRGVSPLRSSSGLVLRPRVPDAYDTDDTDEAKLTWRAWMKEDVVVPEGISCDVLQWWKANSVRFPLTAKQPRLF